MMPPLSILRQASYLLLDAPLAEKTRYISHVGCFVRLDIHACFAHVWYYFVFDLYRGWLEYCIWSP
jgi:hypothetical protein